jgi:translation initiation factor IF-2
MRARGANVTDIAVLVVAADDGIMPQTEEAISHAKAAGVPIVVALNKIDTAGVDANKVMQQLAAHDLLPSEWGGNVEVVRTSAIKNEGIDELLETLLTIADCTSSRPIPTAAMGVCLEAEQEPAAA